MNPIEKVVAPLKKDAIERARQEAVAEVEEVRKELAAAKGNINKAAPYPKSWGKGALYGIGYELARIKHNRYHALADRDPSRQPSATHKPGEPYFVLIDEERVTSYIDARKRWAGEDYDAFVAKLVRKIGEVKKAELIGNHVWSYSTLIVTMPDGEMQAWKTQQIVNHSKLGKPFNQWPTRRMKKVPEAA